MAEPLALSPAAGASRNRHVPDFGSWMASEQRRINLLCRHLLGDWDEAGSAAQDVFLKAFQAWRKSGLAELDDPVRWLTRIAVNTCLDRLRSRRWQIWRRRLRGDAERTALADARDPEPSAEARVLAREIEGRLTKALDRLSLRQRAVFTLKHFEDRSLDEIGAILGLDTGTVKSHLSRAISKLRSELHELYGVPR